DLSAVNSISHLFSETFCDLGAKLLSCRGVGGKGGCDRFRWQRKAASTTSFISLLAHALAHQEGGKLHVKIQNFLSQPAFEEIHDLGGHFDLVAHELLIELHHR